MGICDGDIEQCIRHVHLGASEHRSASVCDTNPKSVHPE